MKRELLFPIFLICRDREDDPFWRATFEDLAYGNPPHGVTLRKDEILCGYRNRSFAYSYSGDPPEMIREQIKQLFSHNLKMVSSKDHQILNQRLIQIRTELEALRTTHWSAIRKQSLKDAIIQDFVIAKAKRHHLSVEQAQSLLLLITNALAFKLLTNRDIDYQDGEIIEIADLHFTEGDFYLDRSLLA